MCCWEPIARARARVEVARRGARALESLLSSFPVVTCTLFVNVVRNQSIAHWALGCFSDAIVDRKTMPCNDMIQAFYTILCAKKDPFTFDTNLLNQ